MSEDWPKQPRNRRTIPDAMPSKTQLGFPTIALGDTRRTSTTFSANVSQNCGMTLRRKSNGVVCPARAYVPRFVSSSTCSLTHDPCIGAPADDILDAFAKKHRPTVSGAPTADAA